MHFDLPNHVKRWKPRKLLSEQAQLDLNRLNKQEPYCNPERRTGSVFGLVSRMKSRSGIRNQELDRYPDQYVTGKPLEAYGPSLLDRHIFWEFVSWLNTSIEVLVSTSVGPFKDSYKSAHIAYCMYRVFT